ncbi:MAG: hypothetical protein CVU39_10010 [Chloroflexi bacterium HGW-Chloroflexi-10]|nr:MAG: hypothetical protein CVU39_10010 [Chloroflexi bacterium HGW-Chloroflexi-10]
MNCTIKEESNASQKTWKKRAVGDSFPPQQTRPYRIVLCELITELISYPQLISQEARGRRIFSCSNFVINIKYTFRRVK